MEPEEQYETASIVRQTYALSDLTRSFQTQIAKTYNGTYYITAEINKLNHYVQSGHCHPQLVEKKNGFIVAKIKGFIRRETYRHVEERFLKITGSSLKDGMETLMRCRVQYHPKGGLSLQILDIDPTYTLGEMHRLRQAAIEQLKGDGVFDANRALRLPMLTRRVAAISVETSKGWQDFTKILDRSPYGPIIQRTLFPSILQGNSAVRKISAALAAIERRRGEFDAVIIVRGGGDETDLDCYDHYALARAICNFPLPVLTGIGHAANHTVSEQVANKNLITPSELAHFLVERFARFDSRISEAARTLKLIGDRTLATAEEHLGARSRRLTSATMETTGLHGAILRNEYRRLERLTDEALTDQYNLLSHKLPHRLGKGLDVLRGAGRRTESAASVVPTVVARFIALKNNGLTHFAEKARILDPARVLSRGYSLVTVDGKTVTDAGDLSAGDMVEMRFAKGSTRAEIREITNRKNE